jgi:hypothetical protein
MSSEHEHYVKVRAGAAAIWNELRKKHSEVFDHIINYYGLTPEEYQEAMNSLHVHISEIFPVELAIARYQEIQCLYPHEKIYRGCTSQCKLWDNCTAKSYHSQLKNNKPRGIIPG